MDSHTGRASTRGDPQSEHLVTPSRYSAGSPVPRATGHSGLGQNMAERSTFSVGWRPLPRYSPRQAPIFHGGSMRGKFLAGVAFLSLAIAGVADAESEVSFVFVSTISCH